MAMANSDMQRPYKGVFPVVPTVFDGDGRLDLDGQKRAVDCMIDAGSHGLCILANFSEQFVLTDAERDQVLDAVLHHVAGRVPVIVTTTHFASHICAERSKRAQAAGAAMVMVMPPYHGATIRVGEAGIYQFYRTVSEAVSIPVMIQDAPVAGTSLSAPFLARMARELENISYFKIEMPQAAAKTARIDRARRRGDRRPLGWRGSDHVDGRSRCRSDRRDDRWRLS
jgi:2-keto-3-deoxy-L-arabinonate dehydratase